ncbi:MAG: 30S ribosomal protein S12 methylthiotransferase RimO [Phycisphaerae bacterium]|jgi:ribosomal protein S12 methylthiotransferase|nr:30S ribosomal protein S12 methylthiotransferase RimO [Phycisphaerae bacterium]MCZ2400999.1 30S ribosomal protein S12 methylthiotransferase RimO [Phycisphaerae bacterium]NUQ49401.1 30S ribosomal protein S12 methylthiotransferase RimO [Phycisphaerae bacterium]
MNQYRPPHAAGTKRSTGRRLPVLGQAPAPVEAAPRGRLGKTPVVSFVSLGCAKNLVDSEMMLGQLAESGAVISGDEALADTVVVNTCGFLESSRTEALDILRELAQRKRAGGLKRIVVAGCLVQRDGERIREWVPEVDALVGVNNRDDVVRAVWRMDRDAAVSRYLGDYHASQAGRWQDQGRMRLTPRHYAYVRISEGCNQKCTFCTIPSIRGPLHCKPPAQIVAECRELIADGARELILIGQDTTSYGEDIGYGEGLAGLLRMLDRECDGADWIRLMYVYPSVMTDAMIDAIAECQRIVKYIDIPLQHINDRVLKAMYRRVTRRQTEALLERLRKRIPGVTIRTTFIVGFPGETESEFGELLSFIDAFEFDAVGAFRYSLEPDTPAGRMKQQIGAAVSEERYARLMLAQQKVALAAAKRRVGQRLEVLVDSCGVGVQPASSGIGVQPVSSGPVAIARHAGQAPEVDSVSLLTVGGKNGRGGPPSAGEMVAVRCVGTLDYDLVVAAAPSRRSGAARATATAPPR